MNSSTTPTTPVNVFLVEDNPADVALTRLSLEKNHVAHRRSEEHTSELQSLAYLVCRLLLEKKKDTPQRTQSEPIGTQLTRSSPTPHPYGQKSAYKCTAATRRGRQ